MVRRTPILWTGIDRRHFQVPVIAVFTKYEQFRREVKMKLEDENRDQETEPDAEVENVFNQQYLARLTGSPPFIRLESEVFNDQGTYTVLILLLKECTDPVNCVKALSKSPPVHSLAGSLP
jgi:hypothetical protein